MIQLIGGEMLAWSDLDGTHGPAPAGGPVLGPLLPAVTGRALIAGPHAPELIDAIPAEQITLLVRGVADAETLAARYAERPGVTICCGGLEKLAALPSYDTVVALDGLDRLPSAESPDLTWDETLSQVLALLRPGGRLLLAVENLFGVHRLLTLPPTPADTDWAGPDDHDPSRPASPERLRARLAAAGVPVVRDYAVYPAPHAPTALLGGEVLSDPSLHGYLEATLVAAARPGEPAPVVSGRPGQSGPAVSARLGQSDAAVSGRSGQSDPAVPDSPGQPGPVVPVSSGPAALLADPAVLITGALRHDLAGDLAPGWLLLAGDVTAGPAALIGGAELRRAETGWVLDEQPVPLGRTLLDLLLAACHRRALPAVRDLLTAWQGSRVAGVTVDQVVVDEDGTLHGVAPAGKPLEALRELAARLLAGGYAHLWPSPLDESALTALLAGMTGRELDPAAVPRTPRPGHPSLSELLVTVERLERELAEARAERDFLERTVVNRDFELKRVRQINAALSATAPGKVMLGGLKAGRRAMRAVLPKKRD